MNENEKNELNVSDDTNSSETGKKNAETNVQEKKAFLKAFCRAKTKLEQPKHDSSVTFKSVKFNYASLNQILSSLKVFNDEGISFIQSEIFEDGKCFMGTTIFHVDGYEKTYKTFLKGNFQSEKDFASSVTYARRYALCSIFGLYGSDDIDSLPDIVKSQGKQLYKSLSKDPPSETITIRTQTRLENLMKENVKFSEFMMNMMKSKGKTKISEIPSSAEAWLDSKIKEFEDKAE